VSELELEDYSFRMIIVFSGNLSDAKIARNQESKTY